MFLERALGFEPTTVLGSRIDVSSRKAPLSARSTALAAVRPSRKHFTEVFSLVCKLFARLAASGGRSLAVGGRFKSCPTQSATKKKQAPDWVLVLFGCGGRI